MKTFGLVGTKVKITIDTGYVKYPSVIAVFDGTNTARFWKEPYLKKSIVDAVNDASDDKDIFDFANFIFASVNNAVKRRYKGQELMLESVEALGNAETSAISYR